MLFKRCVLILLFSMCLVGCATNQGVDGNYLKYLKEDNQKLGVRYLLGRGVKQDNQKAFYYFSLSAKQGDAFSQNEVAYLYATGKGTERNYAQSVYWYKQAANQGLASAQYNLGFMYMHGLGVTADPIQGKQWYQKSAQRGFKPAIIALQKDH